MRKAFRFRIQPSKNREVVLFTWLNKCRRLYNACLEQRQIAYRSCGQSLSAYDQTNQLPELKKGLPEYSEVQSRVLQDVVRRADKSFKNFPGTNLGIGSTWGGNYPNLRL